MKKIIPLIVFIASLSFQIGFALTIEQCDELLKTGGEVDALKLRNLTTEQLIECSTPSAAKTGVLSPYDIFILITNSIAVLTSALAILALVVSTIKMATSAGDKTKFQEGITLARNAGIALALTISVYTIVFGILNTLGFQEIDSGAGTNTSVQIACISNETKNAECTRILCPQAKCNAATANPNSSYCAQLCRTGTGGTQ